MKATILLELWQVEKVFYILFILLYVLVYGLFVCNKLLN